MKYLSQFLIIMGFTVAGEALQRIVPLPIPASVYGLALLFAALCLKLVKVEQVKEVGGFLASILPVLFVSPTVGIVEHWAVIRPQLLPIALLLLASTLLTFGISGGITQLLSRKGGEKHA
ncbi:MAG: CidA/LrgA family protein [Oscillospiraceae bacterium]|nr:CidA/LrgA family protein [Oscillospiraceae bacterium]